MTILTKQELVIENDQVIVTAQVVAMVFGVTTRTINDWSKRGCPKVKKNTYNLREVIKWKYSTESTPEGLEAKKQKADIRYREARADMEELKRKNMIGEYVAVADIEADLAEVFSKVRIRLSNLKHKVLQDLNSSYPEVAFEVSELIEQEMERGLKQLARTKL